MYKYVRMAAVVGLSLAGVASANVVIDTVRVGNPGNAGDTRYPSGGVSSFGAVGYTYNIGKYEVTAGQYTAFLNKVGGVDTYGLYNTEMSRTDLGNGITRSGGGTVGNPYTYEVFDDPNVPGAEWANRPVNYVSYWDSCRFANWLHNAQPSGAQGAGTTETGAYTLTTDGMNNNTVARNGNWQWAVASEDEWYKAAYYKGGSTNAGYWDYPTSSNTAPGQDMADVSGNNANYYTAPYVNPIDSGKYTTVVGEFQNSDSPYGTFDQGGNVFEWNEAVISGSYRGQRGGSFIHLPYDPGFLHAADRGSFGPSFEGGSLGFRVSEVPEPATIVLLALASVGIIRKRRA